MKFHFISGKITCLCKDGAGSVVATTKKNCFSWFIVKKLSRGEQAGKFTSCAVGKDT